VAKPKRDEKPATYNEKTKNTEPKDETLTKVVERFRLAKDYAESHYYEIWEDSWKAYHNERTSAQYDGVANNFVPETFTIVESIKANIIGGEQRFEYYPTRSDQKADTKALNSLVEHYWYVNNFPAESLKWIQDDIVLGTGFLWTFWDETRGVTPLYVPLRDNFVDPTAKNYQDAQYAGFRYLTTLDQLKDEMTPNENFDEEQEESDKNPRLVPRFKNLDKLKDMPRKDKDELDKERKDQLLGSTLGKEAKDKQIEVIYYIDKEKVCQVANRSVVIEEVDTPFKREARMVDSFDDDGNPVSFELPEIPAFIPFAPARNYIDGSLFYAKGDVEVILDSQELLNDTSSQKTDNLTYIVNKIALIDPAYSDEEDKLDSIPGAKWFVPPGAVEWLNMQPIGADADNEMARITDAMRRATAADEIIQGKGSGGRTTATEIRAQLAQAGTRFSIKLKNLEREGLKILADNMFKLIQIHVTQEIAVRTIGPDGAEFLTFNPGEYLGDYEPRVMLDTTAAAVQEEEKQNAMMFYQMASQMPFVDQQQLFKQTAEKMFNMEPFEVDALIQEQPPMPMGMEGEMMGAEGEMSEEEMMMAEAEMEGVEGQGLGIAPPEDMGIDATPIA
jgi:hypothetical protein